MTQPLNAAEHDAYWRPLGELLVERGLLSADELAAALDEQERTGGFLGEILIRRGLLSSIALTSTLSEQALGEEGDTSFGSGLRSALAGSQQLPPVEEGDDDAPSEIEGGFGSGLRRALERRED
jgi:hypothetical protein